MKKIGYIFVTILLLANLNLVVGIADIAQQYDIDNNGEIDKNEAVQGLMDYFIGNITKQDALDVVTAYFSQAITKIKPEPYFPSQDYTKKIEYSPGGLITGVTIGVEVRNRGGAGEVFVTVVGVEREDLRASKAFYMDKDENIMVRVHFDVLATYWPGYKFKWTARTALPNDTSQGEIRLARSNMKQVGHLDVGNVRDIAVSGDFAYVVVEERWPYDPDPSIAFMANISLKVIDISNVSNPRYVGRYDFSPADTAFSKYGIRATDNYVYVAIGHYDDHDDNGLHIIDVSDTSVPRRVGQYHTEGGSYDVAVAGNYTYVITDKEPGVTGRGESFLVFDVSTPSNPRNVGQYEISGLQFLDGITVKGSYAYIVGHGRLLVIDISVPNLPREATTQRYNSLTSGKDSITVSDGYVYITTPASLYVFDIGIPSSPTETSNFSFDENDYGAGDISVSGNRIYIAYREGLSVIDISNSSIPVQVGRYTGMRVGSNCVTVSGNYVYLGGSGLHIIESKV